MITINWGLKVIVLCMSTALLAACGSGGGSTNQSTRKVEQSSSQASSSSEAASYDFVFEYIYPAQNSYVGQRSEISVQLKISVDGETSDIVESVQLGDGNYLTLNGDVWGTSSPVILDDTSDEQAISIKLILTNGDEWDATPLLLNTSANDFGVTAGNTRVAEVTSLAVSDNGVLYFTGATEGGLYRYDATTAESKIIYDADINGLHAQPVSWSIQTFGSTVYLAQDIFSIGDTESEDLMEVSLVKIDDSGAEPFVSYFSAGDTIKSSKHLFVDAEGKSPHSSGFPSAFSLDALGLQPLVSWYDLGEGYNIYPTPLVFDSNVRIEPQFEPLALAGHLDGDNTVISIIQYHKDDTLVAEPTLFEIRAEQSFALPVMNTRVVATFKEMSKPTAMLYSEDGGTLYVADNDRLWAVDTSTYEASLVSATVFAGETIGQGPALGGAISSLSQHPHYPNLLYAATGTSVMVINVETGDRLIMVK